MRTLVHRYDAAIAQLPGWLQFAVNFVVFAVIGALIVGGLAALLG